MKNLKLKMNTNENSGFTLIETLVALSIFAFSVLSIVVVTGQGINDVNYSKNKLSATLLADEGVELVRNIRDTYALGDAPTYGWNSFKQIAELNYCEFNCMVDPVGDLSTISTAIKPCSASAGCPILSKDDTSIYAGYFRYGAKNSTPFTRNINVAKITGQNDVLIVTSTVEWTQGQSTKSVTVSEPLYNWYTKN